ncbi:hypothetical protein GOV14_04220, partial [Candidatus Pacearchaeota archaeon]|nr:hypothetical protein [Candidatus Pacearchaeota archaeon]
MAKIKKKKHNHPSLFIYSILFICALLFSLPEVMSFAGRICGSTSPCTCGENCTGGNELFGNSQAYCDANAIECFNTIDNCRDGTVVSLNNVKDITITSFNDSVFRVGDLLEIDATLHSSSVNIEGVIFVYANGTANETVNWSAIYSTTFGAADSNYHIKYNYTIPNKIDDHTVRIIDAYKQYRNITCGRHAESDFPSYTDTDDLTFTVLAQPAPVINFTGPTPSNQSTQTTVTVIINVTHNETHPDTLILNWNGTSESQSYSGNYTTITKSNLRQGNYTFYVWVNDTYGNINQTETRIVSVNIPIDITIESPASNGLYSNSSINLNITVKPTQSGKNITWVRYQLNQDSNVSLTSKLNISSDLSDPDGVINESTLSYQNLSQSFAPNQAMEIKNLSIKIKKIGNPNATIQIRTNNVDSPSNTVLGNISIDNSTVSDTEFSWVNISFNSTIALQNNTKYWLFLSPNGSNDYYAWEASDENISANGECLQNTSRDLLFRIFDYYKYRTTLTASEGGNNLTIYANNSDGEFVSSSRIIFTVDTVPPTYQGINESQDPIEVGRNITISINVSDDSSSVNTVLLEFNSTNQSMISDVGDRYNFTFETLLLGLNNFSFYMNDSLGNLNSTSKYNFTVVDTTPPIFSNISNTPSSADDMDPNVMINITINIDDKGVVDTAKLQYKKITASDWTNTSMSNRTNLYYGSFTPNAEDNWTFRLWANDTTGNANFSSNSSINTSYDYSWTRAPSSFSALSGIKDEEVTIGNLTVNNTGDYLLSFSLSSSRVFVSFNKSTPFTLEPHNYSIIEVNATAPTEEAEYSIVVTIDADNTSAIPGSLQTNSTLVSISSGPYLYLQILQYNASLNRGDFTDLIAKITNIGNETATGIVSNWTIPSDWTNIPEDLNKTLGDLGINEFQYHNISAYIPTGASTGSKTISIYTQSLEGANNTLSKSVTIISGGSTESPETSSGGSSGASGGGGGIVYKKPDYDILVEAPKKIELMAEQKRTIELYVTNNIENTLLKNLKITASGFLLTRMDIQPRIIKELGYDEKKKILLTINVPKYMKHQNLTLVLEFKADARNPNDDINNSRSEAVFEKKVNINLIILEITKDAALRSISEAEENIASMRKFGFNTDNMVELLSDAKKYFEESNYKKVKEIADKIAFLKQKAVLVDGLIKEAKEKIKSSEDKGIDITEAAELLQLGIGQFEKGNFEKAEELINKALISERLSAKTSESNIFLRFVQFIKDYWIILILISIIAITTALALKKEFSIKGISDKLTSLDKEETVITNLIKKAQVQYFKEKMMSERLYRKIIDGYMKRMAEIQNKKANLHSRKVRILKKSEDCGTLQKEKSAIEQLIKETQSKYFVKKIITKETYQNTLGEYNKRKAELEKSLEILSGGISGGKSGFENVEIEKEKFGDASEMKTDENGDIAELNSKNKILLSEISKLKNASMDKKSIKKMISVFDEIIKKIPKNTEGFDLSSTTAIYKK